MTAITLHDDKNQEESSFVTAIRLFNTSETECSFETGKITSQIKIPIEYFFFQTKVGHLENIAHPAPRRQYVVTIKGKLKFTVSNGETFILEPGIILVAEDILGPGHSWEIIDGEKWERIYIPLDIESDSYFIADSATI